MSLPFSLTRLAAALTLALAGGLLSGAAKAQDVKAGALTVVHPWSRATPGGAKIGAGYAVIDNTGETPDRLVSATAAVAEKVSAHSMTTEGGVMKMRALPEGIVVPAKGSVALKPGSMHLMFEGLKRPLKAGDSIPGTLTFEKAGTVPVTFTVEALGAKDPHADHGAMKGMKMD